MKEYLSRFSYSLRKYPKIKKKRIFIIGFNKTATRTIHYFFKNNGLESIHWDNNNLVIHFEYNLKNNLPLLGPRRVFNRQINSDCLYSDAIVFSDITYNLWGKDPKDYYKILDKQYPESKFIFNYRDVNDWIKSRSNHGKLLQEHLLFYSCSNFDELKNVWKKLFESHFKECKEYFKKRKADFLEFNIDEDGPEKICNFLKDYYPNLNINKWRYRDKKSKKE